MPSVQTAMNWDGWVVLLFLVLLLQKHKQHDARYLHQELA